MTKRTRPVSSVIYHRPGRGGIVVLFWHDATQVSLYRISVSLPTGDPLGKPDQRANACASHGPSSHVNVSSSSVGLKAALGTYTLRDTKPRPKIGM